jgi:hypothetical protein
MSIEYLDKCYNDGIEITDIIGGDKVIETIENVDVTETKFYYELNNIISNDEELSIGLETIKELNKKTNSNTPIWEKYPIICSILFIICFIPIAIASPATLLLQFIDDYTNPVLYLLASIWLLPIEIFVIIPAFLFLAFGCIDFNPF